MKRSLICVHCGIAVPLEPRTDPVTVRLATHMLDTHCEIAAFDRAPRWAQLLEHFFVVPLDGRALPPLCMPVAPARDARGVERAVRS